jgi:hypothetical protein
VDGHDDDGLSDVITVGTWQVCSYRIRHKFIK